MLTVIVSRPVVRDKEQLLDVPLEKDGSHEQVAQRGRTWGPRDLLASEGLSSGSDLL